MSNRLSIAYNRVTAFIDRLTKDRIGVYAAQASFFIMLSIFPFLMLILNVISFTPLDKDFLVRMVDAYTPEVLAPLIEQIINEMYSNISGTVISLTAIIAVWSASKGVLSVLAGMHNIYHVQRKYNYFIIRFLSMIQTVFFVIAMVLSLVLLVFGNRIFKLAISYIPPLAHISLIYVIGRYLIVFILLSLIFIFVFRMTNLKMTTIKTVVPGSLLSALGWMLFSYVFSIYVDNFSNMTYMYGSMTALIIIMLWIYFCIYILFIGAEINKMLCPDIEHKH